jgi:ring-1,2-phenylacetyl-CoA epoxidase subunit PaaC
MKSKTTDMVFEGLLRIADDNLILGHRTSEWCGHAPTLEEDLALPNIALDLIGHAQTLYCLACEIDTRYENEDQLAFLRLEHEYKKIYCLLSKKTVILEILSYACSIFRPL